MSRPQRIHPPLKAAGFNNILAAIAGTKPVSKSRKKGQEIIKASEKKPK
jgi:hypothetical protein